MYNKQHFSIIVPAALRSTFAALTREEVPWHYILEKDNDSIYCRITLAALTVEVH
jgi:hypothetical protein